jgi:hypothetical protein
MVSEALPPVYLNHVFVVLDHDSYRAMTESAFVRDEFAVFEQKTVSADEGESWTGTYLIGANTYLELFSPSGVEGASVGSAGVAFGVEQPGSIVSVHERLQASCSGVPDQGLRHWTDGQQTVPWFHYVDMPHEGSEEPFGAWVMEYHPAIFQHRSIPLPATGLLSREAYLRERFSAQPSRLLKDIVGVTLALGNDLAERVGAMLRALGYEEARNDDLVVYEGPDVRVCVATAQAESPYRIRALSFSLRRRVDRSVVRLGAESELKLHNDTAEWRFGT